MAQKNLSFSLDKEYALKNDGSDLTLDVIIGDIGQKPDFTVKLNSKVLKSNGDSSLKGLLIGKNQDLDNKVLRINGNIADTSKDSNLIKLTLRIKGGEEDLVKKFSVTTDDEGEIVIFSLIIRFFI